MNKYLNNPLSQYDLKVLCNSLDGSKNKPYSVSQMKQILYKFGYQLEIHRYYNYKTKKNSNYYVLNKTFK